MRPVCIVSSFLFVSTVAGLVGCGEVQGCDGMAGNPYARAKYGGMAMAKPMGGYPMFAAKPAYFGGFNKPAGASVGFGKAKFGPGLKTAAGGKGGLEVK